VVHVGRGQCPPLVDRCLRVRNVERHDVDQVGLREELERPLWGEPDRSCLAPLLLESRPVVERSFLVAPEDLVPLGSQGLVPGLCRLVLLEWAFDLRPERLVDRRGHLEFVEEHIDVRAGEVGGGSDSQHTELAVDGRGLHAFEKPRLEQEADGRRDEPMRQRGAELFGHRLGSGHRACEHPF
jgi:hypothetical protein